jgi:parallel beta-helix repeat protein
VKANFSHPFPLPEPAFFIRADGSVDPSTAPIHRKGDIYTFTDNIVGYTIIVEKDNIVLDGGGYGLRGYGNSTGIYIMNRQGVTVRNTKISGFTVGIDLSAVLMLGGSSSNNRFENNLLTDNYYGIQIVYSSSTTLRNNVMKNNTRNFYIIDIVEVLPELPNLYVNDIDSSNTVDGKPIIYWLNKQNQPVPSNAGFVALVNCANISIQNLNLAHSGQGIMLISTNNSLIAKNQITHTDSGIYLYKSSNIQITGNSIENSGVCVETRDSSNCNISSNQITRSGVGIALTGSKNNIVLGNAVTANTNGISFNGLFDTTIKQNNISENSETGVQSFNSVNNILTANTITRNGRDGIALWEGSTQNIVSENLIANNSRIGILIRICDNNSIVGNMITKNANFGIRLVGKPSNNVIFHNNFIENNNNDAQASVEVFSDGPYPNSWDNGVEGNYWSDYKSSPYFIGKNNQDNHPLPAPMGFNPPEPPSIPLQEGTTDQFPWLPVAAAIGVVAVVAAVATVVYLKKRKRGQPA